MTTFTEFPSKGIQRALRDADLHEQDLRIHISQVGPGERSHPPHRHGGFEAFYILEGQGTLEIDDTSQIIQTGETITFDAQKMHGLVNSGEGPLRYMVVRAGQE